MFYGLINEPLGSAVLSITPQCKLRVDNISATGLDGAAQVGLGSLYMAMTLERPNFSLSAAGTRANILQLGVVEGTPGQEIMFTQLVNYNDTHVRQSVTCESLGTATYTVHIYNGDRLVEARNLGSEPPDFSYPKTDISWMACGIKANGDVYSAIELGAAAQITLLDSPDNPGPFTGDFIFVQALSPQLVSEVQESIVENFVSTGPVGITAMFALPTSYPPGEIANVALEGVSPTVVSFDSQEDLTGPSTTYGVVTGLLSQMRQTRGFSHASCLGAVPDTPALDSRVPPVGDGYYYLVRGRTLSPLPGPGSYGDSTLVPDPRDKIDDRDPCRPN